MICCQFRTRKLFAYLLALGFGFLLGTSSYAIVSRFRPARQPSVNQDYTRRIEEWHRLREAAGMTGDPYIMMDVFDHLACTTSLGETQGVMIEVNGSIGCQMKGSNPPETVIIPMAKFSTFAEMVVESHSNWSLKNLDFLKSVVTESKARRYVSEHRWPK